MRLEPELWDALEEICDREHIAMRELVRRIEQTEHVCGRTSAVRVYIVDYFRAASTINEHVRPPAHMDMAMVASAAASF